MDRFEKIKLLEKISVNLRTKGNIFSQQYSEELARRWAL